MGLGWLIKAVWEGARGNPEIPSADRSHDKARSNSKNCTHVRDAWSKQRICLFSHLEKSTGQQSRYKQGRKKVSGWDGHLAYVSFSVPLARKRSQETEAAKNPGHASIAHRQPEAELCISSIATADSVTNTTDVTTCEVAPPTRHQSHSMERQQVGGATYMTRCGICSSSQPLTCTYTMAGYIL